MVEQQQPVSIAYAALCCRCPRCGTGKLYSSLLTIAERCDSCKLPLSKHEQGDGSAFFGVLFVGALTAILAAIVEVKFQPPFWLHAVIWIPFIIIGSLLSLRCLKAALIAMQYHYSKEDFEA